MDLEMLISEDFNCNSNPDADIVFKWIRMDNMIVLYTSFWKG